jgi:hypothetical protein
VEPARARARCCAKPWKRSDIARVNGPIYFAEYRAEKFQTSHADRITADQSEKAGGVTRRSLLIDQPGLTLIEDTPRMLALVGGVVARLKDMLARECN